MAQIEFDRNICSSTEHCFSLEWLETNGLGGFASSSISGANTRRYHGLLMAAIKPPTVRCLLLSKIEETLIVGGQRFDLSSNLYPGAVYPEGYKYLTGFRLDPFPVFTFEAGGVTVEKRVFLVQGENTVVVEYETASECRMELRPLIAFRDYHSTTHANPGLNAALHATFGSISIRPYADLPELFFAHNGNALRSEGSWYHDFEYIVERERGLDFHEDLYCPFALSCDLAPGQAAVVIASTAAHKVEDAPSLKQAELARRKPATPLETAADQFIVARGAFRTIIAGYPWFTDWGRDTMISLPGITLVTGRYDVARDLFLAFAASIDQGMLPNRFTDGGDAPEYNTVDATLWFFEAIRKYLDYTDDVAFVREHLYEHLKDILAWHVKGTRYGIREDVDGLLRAGDANTQLTWMDARVGDRAITPRWGKPVEIEALWYNALRFVVKLAMDFSDKEILGPYKALASKAEKSFNASFWNEGAGCLYDVVDGDRRDGAIRPNQLIALSLGYCMVPEDRARRIIEVAARDLLTPYGLRTLSPSDPGYCGRCTGPPHERDAAYHQGTIWPWLLGPFITADVRFNGDAGRRRADEIVAGVEEFVRTRGVGQMPEIFDGDAPHHPRGCPAQAWSVAEILRAGAESKVKSAAA